MSQKQRFELVVKVAEMRKQEAARVLADDKMALQESRGKLEELLIYRTDFSKDMSNGGSPGYGVQLRDHCLFLNRLNRAITAQRQQLDQRGNTVMVSEKRWQDAHKQVAIMNKVVERTRSAERAAADRRDQKWVDELAGAAHARRCRRN